MLETAAAALTHGGPGLALAYGIVGAPLLAGMVRAGASPLRLLAAPLIAIPVTAAAGAAVALAGPVFGALGMGGAGLASWALGATASAAAGYLAGRHFAHGSPLVRHQRGAVVVEGRPAARPPAAVGRQPAARDRNAAVTLAGVPVTMLDETKHFKIIGTTGTGKSTAIHEILSAALARGDRAVIADPDGGYLRRFYRPERGDVILNPFEPRSRKWDLFAEITQPYDVDQLARSLIPDHEGSDRSWRGYARTFFTAVTRQAHTAGIRDVGELYRLLVTADSSDLRVLVRGTPAQPFLEEHNSRMFDSIRSVTSSAAAALEYIGQQRGQALSVREWVRQGGGQADVPADAQADARAVSRADARVDARAVSQDGAQAPSGAGVLFIPYQAGQIAALRSQISAWMRLAIFEAMNRPEADQRLWFVVDELDALGQIDGLKDALARLRKFGGRCALGFQSVAQVSSTYGEGDAHTIVENCGNTLLLRASASEGGGTARFASRLIGEREVLRTSVSRSRRPLGVLSSRTLSDHVAVEAAVLPSQIEQLPDLQGYLKLASRQEWMRVKLVPVHEVPKDTGAGHEI